MASFTDLAGRQWTVALTVGSVKRVKDRTGILLTKLFDDNCTLMSELWGDVIQLVDVLWVLVEPQADGVTAEQFAESLGGDVLGQAAEALGAAAVDFFPNPEQRAAISTLLTKAKETQVHLMETATTAIANLDAELLAKGYISSVSSAQELPESNLGDLPLAS